MSQTQAFKRLRGVFGLGPDSRSAFLPFLADKPVPAGLEAALAKITGWPTEEAVAEKSEARQSYEDRHLALLEEANRQAKRQADAWETIAAAFTPGAPTSPFGQSIVGLIQAFAAEQGHAPLPLPADREPSLGR